MAACRRLALQRQGLATAQPFGRGLAGTLKAIEHLGYVQIDTISVIERAHHHVLWTRVPGYRPVHLAALLESRDIFEYWFHAAACLPMRDYRFALPRMAQIRRDGHMWFGDVDSRLMREILAQIRAAGPQRLRDLAGLAPVDTGAELHAPTAGQSAMAAAWQWKPLRRALDTLFMQGDLMICAREGMEKVYDLAERVLPQGIDTSMPSVDEQATHLLQGALRAQGVITLAQVLHLRPGKALRDSLRAQVAARIDAHELRAVALPDGSEAFLPHDALDAVPRRLPPKVRLLSPFDNLVIHRERLAALFGFDYRLECYVPPARRRYGYFCLPILYGEAFVGRVDCKAHRARRELEVLRLHLEPGVAAQAGFSVKLTEALMQLAAFNGCDRLRMDA